MKWCAGVLSAPPDRAMAEIMRDKYRIIRYHYCQIRPGEPDTLVVMHSGVLSGSMQGTWDRLRAETGMRCPPPCPQEEGDHRRRPLWRKYAAHYADYRAAELEKNYVVLDARPETSNADDKENQAPQYGDAEPRSPRPGWLQGGIFPDAVLDRELPLPASCVPTPPTLERPAEPDTATGPPQRTLGKVKRSILGELSGDPAPKRARTDAAAAEPDAPPRPKGLHRGRPPKPPAEPDALPRPAVRTRKPRSDTAGRSRKAAVAPPPPPPQETPPSVEQCAGVLRGFVESTDHFAGGAGRDRSVLKALIRSIYAMLPPEIVADARAGRFFGPEQVRFLPILPGTLVESESAVELHRRAMALERRVSQLLRGLQGAAGGGLSAEEARDLDAAARCAPESDAAGWAVAPPSGSPPAGNGLEALLRAAQRARPEALQRVFLIADHVTWAVPVLATLFLLRVDDMLGRRGMIVAQIGSLNATRERAARYDTLPLRRYGWILTVIARRLGRLTERATAARPGVEPIEFAEERFAADTANEQRLRESSMKEYTDHVSAAHTLFRTRA